MCCVLCFVVLSCCVVCCVLRVACCCGMSWGRVVFCCVVLWSIVVLVLGRFLNVLGVSWVDFLSFWGLLGGVLGGLGRLPRPPRRIVCESYTIRFVLVLSSGLGNRSPLSSHPVLPVSSHPPFNRRRCAPNNSTLAPRHLQFTPTHSKIYLLQPKGSPKKSRSPEQPQNNPKDYRSVHTMPFSLAQHAHGRSLRGGGGAREAF